MDLGFLKGLLNTETITNWGLKAIIEYVDKNPEAVGKLVSKTLKSVYADMNKKAAASAEAQFKPADMDLSDIVVDEPVANPSPPPQQPMQTENIIVDAAPSVNNTPPTNNNVSANGEIIIP